MATEVAYTKREDTFAPTPPLKGMKIIISLRASKSPRRQRVLGRWDVSVAFFHAKIKDEIYVVPPRGLKKKGKIWRLWHGIYGTQEASKLFQDELVKELPLPKTQHCTDPQVDLIIGLQLWVLNLSSSSLQVSSPREEVSCLAFSPFWMVLEV